MQQVSKKAVEVTITSDLMCPWCWVGLRKLQAASRQVGIEPKITWKPFLLRPQMPEDGMAKGGTPESRVPARLRQAGADVGIDFTGLTDRTPNTTLFHAVMKMLQDDKEVEQRKATEFHEAVFEGYFTLGVFPNKDGILEAAKKVKDRTIFDKIENLFKDEKSLKQLKHEVFEEALEASYKGVSGVPSFEFNGEPAFSGAQSVGTFSRYLQSYSQD